MQQYEQIIHLPEVKSRTSHEEQVRYSDDELVILDNVRELPAMDNLKITFNIVVVCVQGILQLDVAGEQTIIKAGQLIVCHSHAILSNYMVSPDFECKVVCIEDQLLRNVLSAQMLYWNKMVYSRHCVIMDIGTDRLGVYDELRYQWIQMESFFKREIITSLLRVALLELCDQMMKNETIADSPDIQDNTPRVDILFHRFLELVAKRKVKKIPVADYANELCITPKYLSTVCRSASGKSPMKWISEYVVEDIVHYLKNTDLTAKEISDELGFPNASFFGKYVREHLGMAPNEYRKNLQNVHD